jgi:hypothetical protein
MGLEVVAQQRLGLRKAPMLQYLYRAVDRHRRRGDFRVA